LTARWRLNRLCRSDSPCILRHPVSWTAAAEQLLDGVLLAARRRDYPVVTVIGHTDTLGHRAANEQVGLRRAQAVAELLRVKGLEAMELRVESHGERNLLIATPDATAESRNRRVEILVR